MSTLDSVDLTLIGVMSVLSPGFISDKREEGGSMEFGLLER